MQVVIILKIKNRTPEAFSVQDNRPARLVVARQRVITRASGNQMDMGFWKNTEDLVRGVFPCWFH